MIIGLSSPRAHVLSQEFVQGQITKEYIARCSGEFRVEEVVVDQPLLTVSRPMGLNIMHPEGKVPILNTVDRVSLPSRPRLFRRLHYDRSTNTSVRNLRLRIGREVNLVAL